MSHRLIDRGEGDGQSWNTEGATDLLPTHRPPLGKGENGIKIFNRFMEELGLSRFTQHKLTPSHVLSISHDVLSHPLCRSMKDVPWRFLKQLMSLDTSARNSTFCSSGMDLQPSSGTAGQGTSVGRARSKIPLDAPSSGPNASCNPSDLVSMEGENEKTSAHPLDVLCALLHCSDHFLQQEIVSRLSMCQFAVPLLLPAGDGAECTFMLWAMRDIVKRLPSPTGSGGFVEGNLVDIPLPVFSFVRLGECKKISKSKILNQVLSLDPLSRRQDFVHRQMSMGKGSKMISNGLVEMAWYFPSQNAGPYCPQQPFAVANLHGDIQTYQRQFKFLASVSSAMFIFLEEIPECGDLFDVGCDRMYFIAGQPSHHSRNGEAKHLLEALRLSFALTQPNFLIGTEEYIEGTVQEIITYSIQGNPKPITLVEMTLESGFSTDENRTECRYAKLHSLELTHDILLAIRYNKLELKSQKELRVGLAKAEKEMYRLIGRGQSTNEDLQPADTMWKRFSRYLGSDVVMGLMYALTFMSPTEKRYFLKWMWLRCDKCSSDTLLEEAMHRNISYDLVHIYQAECSMAKATEYVPRCSQLPETAADLLLDGFPLTLIGEDTFSVPFHWINDVLTDLVSKTQGQCRVKVISALGVYSSGKSSLLYTMFGLQFQVTRPQHTRGALMSLLTVEDRFKDKLGCDFLLIIDTEGLRAPKLASEEERYEHDNALATFVIGLSDIVIIGLSSESPSDIINILQMATCALLRMRDLGRKPTLYFVQNNVTNASSDGENRNKSTVYECLRETMDLAAKVVKRASYLPLSDVLKCDFSSSQWYSYMPRLWHGDPFNGCINSDYAEKVMKLKQYLFHTLIQEEPNKGRTMLGFMEDLKTLWSAVTLEPILRFEKLQDVITFNELCDLYREFELSMHRELYQWKSKKEEQTSNSYDLDTIKKDMMGQLHKLKQEKIESFRLCLDSEKKQFEDSFMEKFRVLSQDLEVFYGDLCTEMEILRHGMEVAVVEDFRSQEWDPEGLQPNLDLDSYWKDKVGQLEKTILKKHDIQTEFMEILQKDLRGRGSLVTEALNSVENWSSHVGEGFTVDEKHVDTSWYTRAEVRDNSTPWSRLESIAEFLTQRCSRYVLTVVQANKDYEPIHCLEMLQMINEAIRREVFPFTHLFEVDLKFYILSRAAAAFQKTHNARVKAKEEALSLEKRKPPPVNSMKSIIRDKRKAKRFCNLYLKPAMELLMMSTLQPHVIRHLKRAVRAIKKSGRSSHIYVIKGINLIHTHDHCSCICDSHADTISSAVEIFRRTLLQHTELEYDSVDALMSGVCRALASERPPFQRDKAGYDEDIISSTPQQFCRYLDFFIKQLKNEVRPNEDSIREIILKVCERLFRCRKQNLAGTVPYGGGVQSHQRRVKPFHKRVKPGKNFGPRSHPKEASTQRVHKHAMLMEYIFAMNNKRNFPPPHQSQMYFLAHRSLV